MMRISDFEVCNQRNIRLVASESLPPVMVITGPNGCGKSTLLESLRQHAGEGAILYTWVHPFFCRTIRRTKHRLEIDGYNIRSFPILSVMLTIQSRILKKGVVYLVHDYLSAV